MARQSRRTTTTQRAPRPNRAQAPLVVGIPAEHLAVYSEEQQHEIATAQTCYQLRQVRLDPRIPAYYGNEPVDAERLDDAVRILMGLYDAKAMPEVTLVGALGFASLLARSAREAEERRGQPALPMPYRFILKHELDEIDARYTVSAMDDETVLKPRRQRRTKRSEEGASNEREVRQRAGARRTADDAAKKRTAVQASASAAEALPVVHRGGRAARAGTRHGAHVSQALRAVDA